MESTVTSHIGENKGTLTIQGRFDFAIHRDFRTNYEKILGTNGVRAVSVDLNAVDYIDSSALGILLLLREKAMTQNVPVTLISPKSSVRQVLDIAPIDARHAIGFECGDKGARRDSGKSVYRCRYQY